MLSEVVANTDQFDLQEWIRERKLRQEEEGLVAAADAVPDPLDDSLLGEACLK